MLLALARVVTTKIVLQPDGSKSANSDATANKEYRRDLVASWAPDPDVPVAPRVITDSAVAVPLEESPGKDVAEGPGDATVSGEMDRTDADIAAAREARYIAAFSQRRKISILLHQPVASTRVMADVMKLISLYRSMV